MCPLGGKIEGERQNEKECVGAGCHKDSICSLRFWELSRELRNEE